MNLISLVAQTVRHLPTMWETWVRSLGWGDPLEKEMATQSSTLAWKILWMEEPGRLQSMGPQRVGYDWKTSLSLHLTELNKTKVSRLPKDMGKLFVKLSWKLFILLTSIYFWRREWQPTPVFLPGKSHGQRSLAGYCLWECPRELDMTWRLNSNNYLDYLWKFLQTNLLFLLTDFVAWTYLTNKPK